MQLDTRVEGVEVRSAYPSECDAVLTTSALGFIAGLERALRSERRARLRARDARQERFEAGASLPAFLPETADIRHDPAWRVAAPPPDLARRWVEITGPASDPKMVINALNCGAHTYMADAEDAESPTFSNLLTGQLNLMRACRGELRFTDVEKDKEYAVGDPHATLIFRPRGWHLDEAHVHVDGQPMSGALFDFGLFLIHNADALRATGSGPYFYLPKIEGHLEARLWQDAFAAAQTTLGLAPGTIKATVLIETFPAAFEMEEILYELRDHVVGLNCGRWDYIFSYIKTLGARPDFLLPDRAQVTMDKGFLAAYAKLLVQICHRRGAYAMGGMAAQIPVSGDARGEAALAHLRAGDFDTVLAEYGDNWVGKVLSDKLREARIGHDGTWIAHPGLFEIADAAFASVLGERDHQLDAVPAGEVSEEDLRRPTHGNITEAGLTNNLCAGTHYLANWLCGTGCVPLNNLMEDAATAEIARAQVWQWLRHGARLDDGREVTHELVRTLTDEVISGIESELGAGAAERGRYREAAELFLDEAMRNELSPFMTTAAYRRLLHDEHAA
jgi:malate synthase